MTANLFDLKSLLSTLKKKSSFSKGKLQGMGIYINRGFIYLYYRSKNNTAGTFNIAKSKDGFSFNLYRRDLQISNYKKADDLSRCDDFQFSRHKHSTNILYRKKKALTSSIVSLSTTDLLHYEYSTKATNLSAMGAIVSDFKYKKQYVMYGGDHDIHVYLSEDLLTWQRLGDAVLSTRSDFFDCDSLEVEHAMQTDKGIMILYHSKTKKDGQTNYVVGAALFDKDDPTLLLWRASEPVWEQTEQWQGKEVKPLGVVEFNGALLSYWEVEGESIFAVVYSHYKFLSGLHIKNVSLSLQKAIENPILSPNNDNNWEAFNTFNPAAVYEDGKVHLLYRAQGYNYVSVLGYASSSDGINIDDRHAEPIYLPSEDFEFKGSRKKPTHISHFYVSGGGFGGCEDPRATRIDDRVYLTYVAFDGYSPPRVALTSIHIDDFLNHRWLWERPVLISPPGVVDKSAVIFPEKINGKYVIMHRIYPDILIDFVDSLEFDGSTWLKGEYKISPRPTMWDSRKIGAGAPPLRTKDGWLLIYQSVGEQDPSRYKIGAMILDINDPTKVLHRSNGPILEPIEHYENKGFKAGVVYPCGAVIKDNTLFVYYGGADSYVCVATANLDDFLAELKYSEIGKLEPTIISKVLSHG